MGVNAIALVLIASFAIDRIAGIIATIAFSLFGQVRVLASLGIPANPLVDVLLSGLILMGGSDRIADILKIAGGGSAGDKSSLAGPIEIKGTLTLEQSPRVGQITGGGPSAA